MVVLPWEPEITIDFFWSIKDFSISDKIFPKLPCHFDRYIKGWRKNQDRRDAKVASGSNKLSAALEYIPINNTVTANFQPIKLPAMATSDHTPYNKVLQ